MKKYFKKLFGYLIFKISNIFRLKLPKSQSFLLKVIAIGKEFAKN